MSLNGNRTFRTSEKEQSRVRVWRRQWHPTPVLLPGKSHGRRSLVGCNPWALEESDMTEWLHFHFSLSCTGEGNGNPLQCSCLENPRDGGAWWAAVCGVAQSRTGLKWLSSSSSRISDFPKRYILTEQNNSQFTDVSNCSLSISVYNFKFEDIQELGF